MSRVLLISLLLLSLLSVALLAAGCGGEADSGPSEEIPVATGPIDDPNADETAMYWLDRAYLALQEGSTGGSFPADAQAQAELISSVEPDIVVVVGGKALLEGASPEQVVVDSSSNADRVLLYAASTSGKVFQLESDSVTAVAAPTEVK